MLFCVRPKHDVTCILKVHIILLSGCKSQIYYIGGSDESYPVRVTMTSKSKKGVITEESSASGATKALDVPSSSNDPVNSSSTFRFGNNRSV